MDFDPRDVDARDEARWPDREPNLHDRCGDAHEPFTRGLDLPRALNREVLRERDRQYTVRGSETRGLLPSRHSRFAPIYVSSTATIVIPEGLRIGTHRDDHGGGDSHQNHRDNKAQLRWEVLLSITSPLSRRVLTRPL